MSNKVYKDATGVVIEIDMGEDISEATKTDLLVKKGEGSEDTWTATIVSDNYLRYTTTTGDLDEVGIYYIQPDIELRSWSGKGETVSFRIYDDWR